MAYADKRTRPLDPAGLAGATLASGGLVALILFAAPNVIGHVKDSIPTLVDIYIAPPTPTAKPPEVRKDPPPPAANLPMQTPKQAGPRTDNRLVPTPAGNDTAIPAPPEPLVVEPPQPDPVRVEPKPTVRVAAMVDPRHAGALQPPYPPSAQRAELEGVAVVRVLVGTDGRVKAVEIVRSDDASFASVTRDHALRKWRFRPATEDGVAVESWREMTVRFVMPRDV